jgi:hypothetical protein
VPDARSDAGTVVAMMWWDDSSTWSAASWMLMTMMMVLVWGGAVGAILWLAHSVRSDTTRQAEDRRQRVGSHENDRQPRPTP